MAKEELSVQIGRNLSKYRNELGYSREHVASAIGVSLSFYTSVENGDKYMHIRNLIKASDFFKKSLDCLVWGEQDQSHINNISKLLEEKPTYVVDHIEKYARFYVNEYNAGLNNNYSDIRDVID